MAKGYANILTCYHRLRLNSLRSAQDLASIVILSGMEALANKGLART